MIYTLLFLFCFFLRLLSTSESALGFQYVLLFFSITFAVYFLSERKKVQWSYKKFCLILISLTVMLFGTEPLFENDHYRYIWEGKVLAKGINPYLTSPDNQLLNEINFPQRSKIAYNSLTSIYPPISLLFFASVSAFNYDQALILLQVINLLLVLILIWILQKLKVADYWIISALPFLLKEYVQSVHVDLLGAVFLLLFFTQKKWMQRISLLWLSILTKVIPLLIIPFFLVKKKLKLFSISLIPLLVGLPVLIYTTLTEDASFGPKAFALMWKWNAGLYELFLQLSDFSHAEIKVICLSAFVFFYIYLCFQKMDIEKFTMFAFAGLFFCSPVYNAWYGIWLLLPALLCRRKSMILYSLLPCISYLYYGHEELALLASGLTHWCFIWGLYDIAKIDHLSRA